ncbi:myo-inositol-1(or 4)-monophosphatase [Saccharothrix saharensis]|uniref:inositol-phosphate phosphatase n=1 Tax=Saccharothrix saharensis TaxID=571190 RepID=A0A543JRD3_9PSEU|nr:inositol monophosphatase family protein [Saccharothrix saharensis]TQM85406.1 myo-inositol-1(or 4)-monophosphatase [Saccharothrix saharensis]
MTGTPPTSRHGAVDLDELLDVARTAARTGGRTAAFRRRRAHRLFREDDTALHVLVDEARHEADRAIRAVLNRQRPNDGVLGRERSTAGCTDVRWIVDPIGGSVDYLYERPDWAVSVAAAAPGGTLLAGVVSEPAVGVLTEARLGGGTVTNDDPVPLPGTRDLARALVEIGPDGRDAAAGRTIDALAARVGGLRRGGSTAAALARVATGRADALWAPDLKPWDCAAGVLLVQEAGGTVGDLVGTSPRTWPGSGDVLAAAPALWGALRELLAEVHPPPTPVRHGLAATDR